MTNTNDFRKYSYQYDTAALIDSFSYTRGSHAPKVRPDYEQAPRRNLRIKESKGIKSQNQLLSEQRHSARSVARIVIAAVLCLGLIAFVLNSFAVKNQMTRELAKKEIQISNAQSEYISLQSQLNAMFSVSMIDKYAVEKLGMTKVRQGQVQYMDVNSFRQEASKAAAKKSAPKVSAAAAAVSAAKGETAKTKKKAKVKVPENFTPSQDGEDVIND